MTIQTSNKYINTIQKISRNVHFAVNKSTTIKKSSTICVEINGLTPNISISLANGHINHHYRDNHHKKYCNQ